MIKDFTKSEFDEFTSLFSMPNAWHIISKMLSEVDKSFIARGEQTAYIALSLAKKQDLDVNVTRRFVLSALFHDIGSIWSSANPHSEIISFDADSAYERALSSYLFLKYFSPLKGYASIVLFSNGREDRQQMNPFYYLGVKLHLCNTIDYLNSQGKNKDEISEAIFKDSGKKYNSKDVEDALSLIKSGEMLTSLQNSSAHDVLDKYLSGVYFRRDIVRNYLFMVTYCFEFYNTETMFHSRMTASLCYLFGRYLNYDLHKLCVLYTAGLFGDIGKVKIKREIMEKPGKLNPDEVTEMKKHIDYTKSILEGCIKDKEVIDIAYAHHEKLDGSGYPLGLKGDQINMDQRIIAVADIAAALMAKRTYKDAYPLEKTIAELEQMKAEGKLDPQIVDLFVKNQDEIFAYLSNHINRMLRNLQALREERQRLRYANVWGD